MVFKDGRRGPDGGCGIDNVVVGGGEGGLVFGQEVEGWVQVGGLGCSGAGGRGEDVPEEGGDDVGALVARDDELVALDAGCEEGLGCGGRGDEREFDVVGRGEVGGPGGQDAVEEVESVDQGDGGDGTLAPELTGAVDGEGDDAIDELFAKLTGARDGSSGEIMLIGS